MESIYRLTSPTFILLVKIEERKIHTYGFLQRQLIRVFSL